MVLLRPLVMLALLACGAGCVTVGGHFASLPDSPRENASGISIATQPPSAQVRVERASSPDAPAVRYEAPTSPVELKLRPGRYTFKLQAPSDLGGGRFEWTQDFASGQWERVEVALGRERGSRVPSVGGPGALIYIPLACLLVLFGGGAALGQAIHTGYWGDWQGGLLAASAVLAGLIALWVWAAWPVDAVAGHFIRRSPDSTDVLGTQP